ncbi:hypothetical protein K402DRAFT_388324 [Aulographum hederae CBS 113979]|uniref:Uncharacterized protein n=1 Tax=Aulographum hederae CBS 113979 TaxID=1176131 RepID=A0A6G1HFH8_9PEZI|nr:hypothetical protein K402DRAFT_388324 [Aulographum hederae CBS 113979]
MSVPGSLHPIPKYEKWLIVTCYISMSHTYAILDIRMRRWIHTRDARHQHAVRSIWGDSCQAPRVLSDHAGSTTTQWKK